MTGAASPWSQQRVMVAGGCGFIGAHLARKLLSSGAQVTLVDRRVAECGANPESLRDLQDQVEILECDIADSARLRGVIAKQDILFNLAGRSSHQDSMDDPLADAHDNLVAQLALLELCRRENAGMRIVFTSTRQVYGRPKYLPVDEAHPLEPTDINGIHKLAAERQHLLYGAVHGMSVCALRLTNTYGPGMRIKDARQTFLGMWIRELLQGRPFAVWGGSQLRDLNYVDDVVDALLIAGQRDEVLGRVFNLGSREVVSLEELARKLLAVHGSGEYRIEDFPKERSKIDIGDYHGRFDRFAELGWSPRVRLDEGLRRTLAYFGQHLDGYL